MKNNDVKEFEQRTADLFARWENEMRQDHVFAKDGVPFPETYFNPSNRPKILFVLKEMNAGLDRWANLLEYLRDYNDRNQTWNNITRWTLGIQHCWRTKGEQLSFSEVNDIDEARRQEAIPSIAAINLKKLAGFASSDMGQINAYAEKYGSYLDEQVALIDPDIIVSCGVWLKPIAGLKDLAEEGKLVDVHRFHGRDRVIIWMYHPQAMKSKESMYNDLVQGASIGWQQLHARTSTPREGR